jgi:hypothetical protein
VSDVQNLNLFGEVPIEHPVGQPPGEENADAHDVGGRTQIRKIRKSRDHLLYRGLRAKRG